MRVVPRANSLETPMDFQSLFQQQTLGSNCGLRTVGQSSGQMFLSSFLVVYLEGAAWLISRHRGGLYLCAGGSLLWPLDFATRSGAERSTRDARGAVERMRNRAGVKSYGVSISCATERTAVSVPGEISPRTGSARSTATSILPCQIVLMLGD